MSRVTKTPTAKELALKLRAVAKETDTIDEVYQLTGLSPETIKKEVQANTFSSVTRALTGYVRKQMSFAKDLDRSRLDAITRSFVQNIQNNLLTNKGGASSFSLVEPIYIGDRLYTEDSQLTDGIVAKAFLANGEVAGRFIKPKKEDEEDYKITLDGETPIEDDGEESEDGDQVGDQKPEGSLQKATTTVKDQSGSGKPAAAEKGTEEK